MSGGGSGTGGNPYHAPTSRPRDLGDDAALRMILPVGRSMWAIAAGYLGLFSVLIIPAPLALLCGIVAVIEIRRNPKKHGLGRAIFGIVMGGLGTALLLFGVIVLGAELLRSSGTP